MENVDNVKIGDFTDIQNGDTITLRTKSNETATGTVISLVDSRSPSWGLGLGNVTIRDTTDGIKEKFFYHNQLISYKKIEPASPLSPVSTVASDILNQEQGEHACIEDKSFTDYKFGDDITLAQTSLYQSDLKFLDTLEKMKALHQGLHKRNESNKEITVQQCQTIVQQIMETDTNLDSLIEYLVKLPVRHFKKEDDGDIIYTREKQVNFLTPDKTTARGEAGKALGERDNNIINKGAFAKGLEYDRCIFLSNREDKGEKNIIVLTKDGKIIGLKAGGNIITREYKKKRIVSADGITITDIEFETVTSASRSVSRWSSKVGSAPAAGGRRTRRKSKKSSTRKGGQRGGGRCRDACKKVSKKRK